VYEENLINMNEVSKQRNKYFRCNQKINLIFMAKKEGKTHEKEIISRNTKKTPVRIYNVG
jgi:hypothetical protein